MTVHFIFKNKWIFANVKPFVLAQVYCVIEITTVFLCESHL